jgi:16S rRNA (guanine527-N7)-methyltransferase
LRAVDKMELAVQAASQMVSPGGWLALMTTRDELEGLKSAAGPSFAWRSPVPLPGSEDRVLALGAHGLGLDAH